MIFIERDKDGQPFNVDAIALTKYYNENNIQYVLIDFDHIEVFKRFIHSNLFIGSISFMKEVFRYTFNSTTLPVNAMRNGVVMTLENLRSRVTNGQSLFVKPFNDLKEFDGFVCNKYTLPSLDKYSSEKQVLIYEVFKKSIESEWRAFVSEGVIVDLRNYSGSPIVFPSIGYINYLMKRLDRIFPKTYAIDIGIMDDGTNDVIEFTDMWALGSYGMEISDYHKLLRKRYFEIFKQK